MTVAALSPSVSYVENGSTTGFAAPFRFKAPEHLQATRIAVDGTVTELAYGVDYSASGGLTDSGGTLTVAVAAAAGTRLVITRNTPRQQSMNYATADTFPAESHELALDNSMLVDQEQDAALGALDARAVKVPVGEAALVLPGAVARGGKFLAFDGAGNPIPSAGTGADAGLRTDLADPLAGAALVAFGNRTVGQHLADSANLRDFGGDATGVTDCWLAAQAAIAAGYQKLRLPYVPGEANVALFSQFPAASTLVGRTIDIDERITLSVPDNQAWGAQNSQGVRYARPTRFIDRLQSTTYLVQPEGGEAWYGNGARNIFPDLDPSLSDRSFLVAVDPATMAARSIGWNGDDVWATDATSTVSGGDYTVAPTNDGKFHMRNLRVKPGDEINFAFEANSAGALATALVRHGGGFDGMFGNADYSSVPALVSKRTGIPGTSTVMSGILGFGTHESYSMLGSSWTIRINSWRNFTIFLNGYAVATVDTPGVITEVALGAYTPAPGQTVTVRSLTRMRGGQWRGGVFNSVRIYTDSIGANRYDAWPQYGRDAFDFVAGIRTWRVINRGIGGHDSAAQLALMQADALAGVLGDSNTCIIDLLTNDTQGLTPIATSMANIGAMIDLAHGVGMNVIVGVPAPWYTQGQAGPRGQASSNYGRLGLYRAALLRKIAEKHVPGKVCVSVDHARHHGPILANYVNPALGFDLTQAGDPVLSDNIHPTAENARRRLAAYRKRVAGLFARYSGSLLLPRHVVAGTTSNGWNSTLEASIDIAGRVEYALGFVDPGGATRADGTAIYTLPLYLWPTTERRFTVTGSTAAEKTEVRISTVGVVTIYGAVASTTIFMAGASYSIEDREVL